MSTPKPGEIRCPNCHESTPVGAYCTRCGQPIPSGARPRPRGMDREELEHRLRTRRPGDVPYRRGAPAGEPGFDRFEPEPEDALAVREERARPAHNVDNFTERPTAPIPPVAPVAPVADDAEPEEGYADEPYEEPEAGSTQRVSAEDAGDEPYVEEAPYVPDATYDYGTDYDYDYGARPYVSERRSGGGPWLILGILALGLVALLGGVLLAGVLGGGPGVARQTATPTTAATTTPTPTQEQSPTPDATSEPTPSEPGVFADGFTADVQPCASPKMDPKDGCAEDATTTDASSIWVWAGFTRGTSDDVVSITLVDKDSGDELEDASRELAEIGCGQRCDGYLTFSFTGLTPGDYELRVDRNGEFAASTPLTVTG